MSDENVLPDLVPENNSINNPLNDCSPVRNLSKQFQVLNIGIAEDAKSKKHNFLISPLKSIENVSPQAESVQSDSLDSVFSPLLSTVENIGAECDIFDSVSNVANDVQSGRPIDAFFSNTNEQFDDLKNPFDNYFGVPALNPNSTSRRENEFPPTTGTTKSTTQTVTSFEETAGQLLLKIATPYKTKTVPIRGLDSEETDFEKKRDILMQSDKKLCQPKEAEGKARKGRSLKTFMDEAFNDERSDSTIEKFDISIIQTDKVENRSMAKTNVQELFSKSKDKSVGGSTSFSLMMNSTNAWNPEDEFKFGILDSIEDAFEMPAKRIRAEISGKKEKSAEKKTQTRPRRKSSLVAAVDTVSKKQVTFASSDQIIDRSATSEGELSREEHGLNVTPESVRVPLAEDQNVDFKNDDVTVQNPSTSAKYETFSWRSETVERDDVSVVDSDAEDFFSLDSTNIETDEDISDFNHTIPTPLILKTQLLKLENASLNNSCASPLSSLLHMSSNVSSPLEHGNSTVVASMSDDEFSDDFVSVKSNLSMEESVENQIPSDCSTILEATFDENLAPIQTPDGRGEILSLTGEGLEVASNNESGANSDRTNPKVLEFEEIQMEDFVNVSPTCSTLGSSSAESSGTAIINEYDFVPEVTYEDELTNSEDSSSGKEDGSFEVVESDFPKLILTRVDQNMTAGSSSEVKWSENVNESDKRNVSAEVRDGNEIRPMDVEEIASESFANDTSMNATAVFTNGVSQTSPVVLSRLRSFDYDLDYECNYDSVPGDKELEGLKNNLPKKTPEFVGGACEKNEETRSMDVDELETVSVGKLLNFSSTSEKTADQSLPTEGVVDSSFVNSCQSKNTSFTSPNICEKTQKIEAKLLGSLENIPFDCLMNFSSLQVSPVEMCRAVYDGNESSFSDVLNKTRLNSSNAIPTNAEEETVDVSIDEETFNRKNDEMVPCSGGNAVLNEFSGINPVEVTNSISINVVDETFQVESPGETSKGNSPAPAVTQISDEEILKFVDDYKSEITSGRAFDVLEGTFSLDCHENLSMDVEENTSKIVSNNTSMNLTRVITGNHDQISPAQTSGGETKSDPSPVEVLFETEKKVNNSEVSTKEGISESVNYLKPEEILQTSSDADIETGPEGQNLDPVADEAGVNVTEKVSRIVHRTRYSIVDDEAWLNIIDGDSEIVHQTIPTEPHCPTVDNNEFASPETVQIQVEGKTSEVLTEGKYPTVDISSLANFADTDEYFSNEVQEINVEKSDPAIITHSVSVYDREVFNKTCQPTQEDELGLAVTSPIRTAEKVINILTNDETSNMIKAETTLSVTISDTAENVKNEEPKVCTERCDNGIVSAEGSLNITNILDQTCQFSPYLSEASKEDIENKINDTAERTPELASTTCEGAVMHEANETCSMDVEELNSEIEDGTSSILKTPVSCDEYVIENPEVRTPVSRSFCSKEEVDIKPEVNEDLPCAMSIDEETSDAFAKTPSNPDVSYDDFEIPEPWRETSKSFITRKAEDVETNVGENVTCAMSTDHKSSDESVKTPNCPNIWDGEPHVVEIPCVWRGVSRAFEAKTAADIAPPVNDNVSSVVSTDQETTDESEKTPSSPNIWDGKPHIVEIHGVWRGVSRAFGTEKAEDIAPYANGNVPSVMSSNPETCDKSQTPSSPNVWDSKPHIVEKPCIWRGVARAFEAKTADDIEPNMNENVPSVVNTVQETTDESEKTPSSPNIWDGKPHVVEIPGVWRGVSRAFCTQKAEDIQPKMNETKPSVSIDQETCNESQRPSSPNIWDGKPHIVEIPGVWRGVSRAFVGTGEDIEPNENVPLVVSTDQETTDESEKTSSSPNIWDGKPHIVEIPGVWRGVSRAFVGTGEDIEPNENVPLVVSTDQETTDESEKTSSSPNIWDGKPHIVEIPGVWRGVSRAFVGTGEDIEPNENVPSVVSTDQETTDESEKTSSSPNIWDGKPHIVEIPGVWRGVSRAFGTQIAEDIQPKMSETVPSVISIDQETCNESQRPSSPNIWDGKPHIIEIPGVWRAVSRVFVGTGEDVEPNVNVNVPSVMSPHQETCNKTPTPSSPNIWDGKTHVVEIPGVWRGVSKAFQAKTAANIAPPVNDNVSSVVSTDQETTDESEKTPSSPNIWDGKPHVVEIPGVWRGVALAFGTEIAKDITSNVPCAMSTSHETSDNSEKPSGSPNIGNETHVCNTPGEYDRVSASFSTKKGNDIESTANEAASYKTRMSPRTKMSVGPVTKPVTPLLSRSNRPSSSPPANFSSNLDAVNETQVLSTPRKHEEMSTILSPTKGEDIESNLNEITTSKTSPKISVLPSIKIGHTTPSKEAATPLSHRPSRLSLGTPMSLGEKFAKAEKIRENLDKLLTPFRRNLDRLRGPMDASSNNLTLIDHATPMPLFALEECRDGDKTRFVVEMPANLLDISVSALDDLLTVPQSANDGPLTHDVLSNITADVSLPAKGDQNVEKLKKQSADDKKKIEELIEMNEKLLSICSNLSANEAELKRVFQEAENNLRIQMNKYEMMKDYNNRYICEMNEEFDTLEAELKSSKENCEKLELELKLSKAKYENLEVELKSSNEKYASLETDLLKSSKKSSENTRKKR